MDRRTTSRTAALVAAVFLSLLGSSQSSAAELVAAAPSSSGAYLINAVGEVFDAHPDRALRKAFTLTANGRPVRWTNLPSGIAWWNSSLYVANGTTVLTRFNEQGVQTGTVTLPIRTKTVTSSGDALWVVNVFAATRDAQLYRSVDGTTFNAVRQDGRKAENVLTNLLIVGGGFGELYAANTIGPPEVRRVHPTARSRTVALAYERTKFRSTMMLTADAVDDVTIYSLPVRSLFVMPNGVLVALRNREDVVGAGGRVEPWLGRRADRYDATGRHVATAVFPRSAHFVVSATATKVTAISRAGESVAAVWGAPVPGAILSK